MSVLRSWSAVLKIEDGFEDHEGLIG